MYILILIHTTIDVYAYRVNPKFISRHLREKNLNVHCDSDCPHSWLGSLGHS